MQPTARPNTQFNYAQRCNGSLSLLTLSSDTARFCYRRRAAAGRANTTRGDPRTVTHAEPITSPPKVSTGWEGMSDVWDDKARHSARAARCGPPMTGPSPSVVLPRAARAMAGRLSWAVADQAVSSITNFAVGIVVARALGGAAFGAFSLALVTYAVVLNLSRGLGTDPLAVRYSGPPDTRWRAAVRRSSSTTFMVGVAAGVACLLAGVFLRSPTGEGFVALGLVLPALMVQDSWRFACFAGGRGRAAFLNDLIWAAALIPAMAVAAANGSVFGFVLAWGAAGALAALVGCLQIGLVPVDVRGAFSWLGQQRDLSVRYMVENVAVGSAAQLRMYGLGAIAGLADVGAVRGAQLLLGPFLALLMGVSLVSVPEAARVWSRSPRRLPLFCLLIGASQAMAGVLWGLALLTVLPASAGVFLLGSVWPSAAALIIPTTLVVIFGSFSNGAFTGLRALGTARRSLRARLASAAAYVMGGLAGAVADGASGSAWGVAAAMLLSACVAWWQLCRALPEAAAPTAAPTPVPPIQVPNHPENEEARPL